MNAKIGDFHRKSVSHFAVTARKDFWKQVTAVTATVSDMLSI